MKWLLTKGRVPFLIAIALISAGLGYRAAGVDVEISNESMNARDASVADARRRLRTHFGHDEDLLVTVTADTTPLPTVDRLAARIAALSGVHAVTSVLTFEQAVPSRLGAKLLSLIESPPDHSGAIAELEVALGRNPGLTGLLISEDRKTAAIVVETTYRPEDDGHAGGLIDAIRLLGADAEAQGRVRVRLTGVAVQKYDVSRFVGRDQAVLIPAAVLVIAIILWAFFRSATAVLLPLGVTGLTLAWTIGSYAVAGFALNTVTSLLPPVVMVLSIATTLHVYSCWISELGNEKDPVAGVLAVVERLRFPCSFTSLTTAIGLASLVLSDTPAVQQFGAFSALGVLISFTLSFTLVPVLLTFLSLPTSPAPTRRLARVLETTVRWSTGRPVWVLLCAAAVVVPAAWLIPSIRSNTDLVRFLSPSSELRQDTLWVDENLGATNTLDLVLWRSDAEPLSSLADFDRIDRLGAAIAEISGVRRLLGPAEPIAQLHRAEFDLDGPQLPTHQADLDYLFELVEVFGRDSSGSSTMARVLSEDHRRARLSIGVGAIGTARASELSAKIEEVASRILEAGYGFELTGAFHQVAVGSQRIVRDQVVTFTTALVLVVALIGLAFRSITIMGVALIPNIVPLLFSGAVMAALGIDLSTGTAMIGSVVIGLAVDDTIHYLARFRRERRNDRDTATAIRATTLGTGRILTMTSVVLAVGFWVGALGSFTPTIYFSLFSGITMMVALLCDLLVLPAALMLLGGRIDRWVLRSSK